MAVLSTDPSRDFETVQRELESAIFRLRNTFEKKKRVKVLREVRLLIEELDSMIES